MRVPHAFSPAFDDPNLVSCAGLAPVLQLADRAGFQDLVAEHVRIGKAGGAQPVLKVPALVAGRVAGADSIDDMALPRHGGMGRLFGGVRAPSTLGTVLRTFTFGHVRQLGAVASRLLINLTRAVPLLQGVNGQVAQLAHVDVDDTVRQTYGYAKQGAGRGYTGTKGLNVLLGIISTPTSRPLIAAVLRHKACFPITARLTSPVRQAIAAIGEQAWTPIKYTNAVWDEAGQVWISDAEVAEIEFTAFSSKAKDKQVSARLIVRRVPDMNPENQNSPFTVYRHHAVFTNSPLAMLAAEKAYRAHAIIEQVIADLKGGPLAHLPSGKLWANSAWLVCAAMAFNLTRTAGVLASTFHAKATTGTIRRPAHQRPRPARPLGPPTHPAPTDRLALADRMGIAPGRSRTTHHSLTPAHPTDQPKDRTTPDQPATPARPDTTRAVRPIRNDPTSPQSLATVDPG